MPQISDEPRLRAGVMRPAVVLGLALLAPACDPPIEPPPPPVPDIITSSVADEVECHKSNVNEFVDMPGMTLSFAQGGAEAHDTVGVVVAFSGYFPGSVGPTLTDGVFVLLEVDGEPHDLTSLNEGVLLASRPFDGNASGSRSFNFVTRDVPPGNHTLTLRWKDDVASGDGTICVGERTMYVIHR